MRCSGDQLPPNRNKLDHNTKSRKTGTRSWGPVVHLVPHRLVGLGVNPNGKLPASEDGPGSVKQSRLRN